MVPQVSFVGVYWEPPWKTHYPQDSVIDELLAPQKENLDPSKWSK